MTTYSYAEHDPVDDWEDAEAADLRAEARAERRRSAYHWCSTCMGNTGPNSPCAPDEPEDDESEDDDADDDC
jgi:hypothetical protein